MQGIQEFQDLGDLKPVIRSHDMVGPSGVEQLVLDDGATFAESTEAFREVVDEHYGERLDDLTDEGEELVIERLVLQSDELPYIEYTIVDEFEDE